MKAVRLFGKEDIQVVETTVPVPRAGEVLVRTGAALICGTDVRMYKNGSEVVPITLGHEIAGTIAALGQDLMADAAHVAPDGTVVPDIGERLPGRGLWLTARRDIVAAASGKGLFAKAARAAAAAPADLADQVEALLARRCCELLGLARRAGQAAEQLRVDGVTERAVADEENLDGGGLLQLTELIVVEIPIRGVDQPEPVADAGDDH